MEKNKIIRKALIYTRVSTEEQAGEHKQSLTAQKNLCLREIESQGYLLAQNGLYSDPGKSATTMKRPALQELLSRVSDDKSISAVFVQDTDRLARNVADHLFIKSILRKYGVELISTSQPGIKDDPEGKMMDLFVAGFNQFQSDITSRKTIKSLEEKFNSGWWPTKAPLGYENAKDPNRPQKNIIIIDEKRGHLIAELFNLYATGDFSMSEVGDILYRKGLCSKVGKKLSLSKLFEIIKCPFYFGEMRWRGLVKQGLHPPLIKKELFFRCQNILDFNNKHVCRKRKHNFLLRGFVSCANCRQRLTATKVENKKKSYYHCNHSKTQCTEKYIETNSLELQVQHHFDGIEFSDFLIKKVLDKIQFLHEKNKSELENSRKSLLTSKINLEHKLDVAESKLISGVLSDLRYCKIKKEVEEQINIYDEEVFKLDQRKNININLIKETLEILRNIGQSYRKAENSVKRLYLGLFWDKFEIGNKIITKAQKTPILMALEAMNHISCYKKVVFDSDLVNTNKEVVLSGVWGAQRGSNSRNRIHRPGLYH